MIIYRINQVSIIPGTFTLDSTETQQPSCSKPKPTNRQWACPAQGISSLHEPSCSKPKPSRQRSYQEWRNRFIARTLFSLWITQVNSSLKSLQTCNRKHSMPLCVSKIPLNHTSPNAFKSRASWNHIRDLAVLDLIIALTFYLQLKAEKKERFWFVSTYSTNTNVFRREQKTHV